MNDTNDLLPEIALAVKPRKIRAPKHDFKDGNGRVFAHRHSNGNGWVADTAQVAESVKVGPGATVYEYARVMDQVELTGKARICGRAKVMGNVKLLQNAWVREFAVVRDGVELGGDTLVSGHVHISGNTRTVGRVSIDDFALVHNVNCTGPAAIYSLRIEGSARLFDSNVHGVSHVSGTSYLQNASLAHAECSVSGKIINSSVNTHLEGDTGRWVFMRSRDVKRALKRNPNLMSQTPPSFNGSRIVINGVLINTQMSSWPVIVSRASFLLNCSLSLYYPNRAAEFPEFPPGPLYQFQGGDLDELLRRYTDPAQTTTTPNIPATMGIPVIAAVGAVPQFDQPRQRRIMRIEEQT